VHSAHHSNSGLYDGDFETLFERVSENWTEAATRLRKGDFAPNPKRDKDCLNCSYQAICGHNALSEEEGSAE
jgi:radical SAM protein with 4Fe4S-binding SPASM domain